MCKYEMDLASFVEDTERTRFCPQTDRWTDGWTDRRTDKVKPVYFNFFEAGVIITEKLQSVQIKHVFFKDNWYILAVKTTLFNMVHKQKFHPFWAPILSSPLSQSVMTPLHGDYGINIIKGDKNYGLQAAIMVKVAINQKPNCNYIVPINQRPFLDYIHFLVASKIPFNILRPGDVHI